MSFPPSDPDRLPPPNYKKQSDAEWAAELKRSGGGPPLRGLAVDRDYPPTAKDAERVLAKMRSENREAQIATEEPAPSNIHRGSGASKVFGQAPSTDELINTMPGGDAHSAGGFASMQNREAPEPTVINAFKEIGGDSVTKFHEQPCVRESLLTGMGFGVVTGGAAWTFGRPAAKAANYAVGFFLVSSLANYQYCQTQRRREREGMRTAMKIVEEKAEEKKVRAEKIREERRARGMAAKAAAESQIKSGRISSWFGTGRPGSREG